MGGQKLLKVLHNTCLHYRMVTFLYRLGTKFS